MQGRGWNISVTKKEAYIAKVQAVILWKDDIHIVI